MLSISTKMPDLVVGFHPANASKCLSVASLECGMVDRGEVQPRNKALVEIVIRVLGEGEKCSPGGLHSTCLGSE